MKRWGLGTALLVAGISAAVLPGSAIAAVLWEQEGPVIGTTPSSKFEQANADLDSQFADDFLVSAPDGVTVARVFAPGSYVPLCAGSFGPANSVDVFFHAETTSAGGTALPAEAASKSRINVFPPSGLGSGVFDLPIDPPVSLEPGAHWLSVQANHTCTTNGSWVWDSLAFSARAQGAWRNPLDGFSQGCTTFQPIGNCGTFPRDARFRIEGTIDPVVVTLEASIAKNRAKKLRVKAGCGNEACDFTVGGRANVKPAKGSSATAAKRKKLKFKLQKQSASAAANATETIQLKFKKHGKTIKKIKRLIKKKDGKAKITLNASAIDSAGATDSQKLKKKLKP